MCNSVMFAELGPNKTIVGPKEVKTIKTKEVVIEGQYRTETVWAAIMNGNKEEAVLGVVYRRPGISEDLFISYIYPG